MHDFLLAKEVIDQIEKIVKKKAINQKIKKVKIELGQVALSHDGFSEHTEDISIENLQFGLKSLAKNFLKETEFEIEKVSGENWKIVDIEV